MASVFTSKHSVEQIVQCNRTAGKCPPVCHLPLTSVVFRRKFKAPNMSAAVECIALLTTRTPLILVDSSSEKMITQDTLNLTRP